MFFILHLIPLNKGLRKRFTDRIGEKPYRALFRIVILGIIVLGVWGWSDFPNIYFYEPALIMKQIHLSIMFPVVYLWVLAEVPNNLKRYIKHPMLTGVTLWAVGHLLANGDLRSMILFVSFLVFSILAVIAANKRNDAKQQKVLPLGYDLAVLAGTVTVYSLLVHFHGVLFGMPVKPYFMLG